MSNVQKVSFAVTLNSSRTRINDDRELLRLWRDGIASGPGRFMSIDQIKKEARRRTAKAAKATR